MICSYNELLYVAIIKDGEILTKSGRSNDNYSVLMDNYLEKQKNSEIVEKITLLLIVNDTDNPIFEIEFLNLSVKKQSSSEYLYQEAIKNAQHWHSLIEVLITHADIEDKENEKNNISQISSNSIADELKKLAELRDSGVLSDAEFQQQKEKLLG